MDITSALSAIEEYLTQRRWQSYNCSGCGVKVFTKQNKKLLC